MPQLEQDTTGTRLDQNALVPTQPPPRQSDAAVPGDGRAVLYAGLLTVLWFGLLGGWLALADATLLAQPTAESIAILLVTILTPPALAWLLLMYHFQARQLRQTNHLLQHNLLALLHDDEAGEGRGKALLERLEHQTSALNRASESLSGRLSKLEHNMRGQTITLADVSKAVHDRSERVHAMMAQQESGLRSLSQDLAARAREVQDMVEKGALRLQSVSSEANERARVANNVLQSRAEELTEAAEAAAKRADDISDKLASYITDLTSATENARAQADALEDRYAQQADRLRNTTDILSRDTDSVLQRLQDQITAIGHANRQVRESAVDLQGALVQQKSELASLLDDARSQTSQAADHLGAQAAFMQDNVTAALKHIEDRIAQAVNAMETADSSWRDTALQLRQVSETGSAQLQENSKTLAQQVSHLTDAWEAASNRAAAQAEQASHTFSLRADDLTQSASALSDRLAGEAERAHERFASASEAMTRAIEAAAGRAEDARRHMAESAADLQTLTGGAVEQLDAAGRALKNRGAEMQGVSQQAMERAQDMADTFARVNTSIQETTGTVGLNTAELSRTLETLATMLGGLSQEIGNRTTSIEDRISCQITALSQASDSASGTARQLDSQFTESADKLISATEQANTSVQLAAEDMQSTLAALRSAGHDSAERVKSTLTALDNSADQLLQKGAATAMRLEQLRLSLAREDAESSKVSGRALTRLSAIVEALALVGGKLDDMTEMASQRVQHATGEMTEQAENLFDLAKRSTGKLDDVVDAFMERIAELKHASEEALSSVAESGGKFHDASQLITQDSQSVQEQVALLSENARDMLRAARTVAQEAQKADATFDVRANKLLTVATELSNTIKLLDEDARENSTAAFMKLANNIMESLGSIAVDIDRLLENDVPEGLWKRYKKGDIGIFARRLLAFGDRASRRKIADKYKNDGEFRGHVDRYLKQFEDLLQHAMKAERSEALTGTLLSAHMGKLYVLLAQSLGKMH